MIIKKRKSLLENTYLKQIDIAPLIDCVFLLLIFFLLTSNFIMVSGINIKLPKAVTAKKSGRKEVTILISSENIIYLNNKVITMKELEKYLNDEKINSVFIKSDRDACLGIVIEVWDLCKKMGIDNLGLATTSR